MNSASELSPFCFETEPHVVQAGPKLSVLSPPSSTSGLRIIGGDGIEDYVCVRQTFYPLSFIPSPERQFFKMAFPFLEGG